MPAHHTQHQHIVAGYRIIAPQNGDLTQREGTGSGFLAIREHPNEGTQIAHVISGGLKGGFGDANRALSPAGAQHNQPRPDRSVQAPQSGDPIDMATGAFLYAATDLSLGPGAPPFGLRLERSASSADRSSHGPFGPGWTHNFAIAATEDSDRLLAMGHGGSGVDAAAAIVAATVKRDLLNANPGAERLLIAALIEAWLMQQLTGNIVRIDQPGDGRRFSYHPDTKHLDRVDTEIGRALTFAYGARGRIARIADHTGRGVDCDYAADGNLQRVTDPLGRSRTYCWHDARSC